MTHLRGYLSEDQAQRVLQVHQRDIARFVHAQMLQHYWEQVEGYEVAVSRGFEPLRRSAFTMHADEPVLDVRQPPPDKNRIGRYIFGGFSRCLYDHQKFQSDTERVMAVILDREAQRWFKPARGQFRVDYRVGQRQQPYVPDFVAETGDELLLIETKARNELDSPEVLEKARVAHEWCGHGYRARARTRHEAVALRADPHDVVTENMSLSALVGGSGGLG